MIFLSLLVFLFFPIHPPRMWTFSQGNKFLRPTLFSSRQMRLLKAPLPSIRDSLRERIFASVPHYPENSIKFSSFLGGEIRWKQKTSVGRSQFLSKLASVAETKVARLSKSAKRERKSNPADWKNEASFLFPLNLNRKAKIMGSNQSQTHYHAWKENCPRVTSGAIIYLV